MDDGQAVAAVSKPDRHVDPAVANIDRRAWPPTSSMTPSPKRTRSIGSSSRDGTSTGRSPESSARSATRAERLADFTELNVATASTSVPPAVAKEEIVTQSAIRADASPGAPAAAGVDRQHSPPRLRTRLPCDRVVELS
jgi:hypothetical protein